jgi:hypothetical protein
MQLRPRLTWESGSPWVATTRPFCTPTSTEQPVPQKRQAALSQRTAVVFSAGAASLAARAGMEMPAVAAAVAMAWVLMKSRRLMVMIEPPRRGNSWIAWLGGAFREMSKAGVGVS